MNVGENGDQDDRVRLGHVGGADGGKTGPHPLPPVLGGNLRPTKPALSSKRQRAGERGGGVFFLTQSLPPIFAIWGTECSFRGRLQQFHIPAALDSLS